MMRFDLPTVEKLVAHYATLQGLAAAGWRFAVELVPGLTHNGEPAWATVVSDPAKKTAAIKVRDLARTPIDGVADPWTELKVTISHELWHPWVTALLADPSEAMEEALVEAAAQAVVRSASADARIMARSLRRSLTGVLIDAPAAVRARLAKVSARAVVRARGGQAMDAKEVLAAITGQDEAKALEILTGWVAEQINAAQGGAPAHVEPDGDEGAAPMEAREEQPMADPKKPEPAGPPAPRAMPRAVDQHEARARKAADSIVGSAIRARIREERAGGLTLPAALEAKLLKMTDLDRFEERIEDIKAGSSLANGSDATRARVEPGTGTPLAAPPPGAAPKYSEAELIKEGINPILAKQIAESRDPAEAELTLKAARARVAGSRSPWPTSKGGDA